MKITKEALASALEVAGYVLDKEDEKIGYSRHVGASCCFGTIYEESMTYYDSITNFSLKLQDIKELSLREDSVSLRIGDNYSYITLK